MPNGEKKKLEAAAAEYFLRVYNERNDSNFALERQSDKPDIVAADGRRRLGIEITHLYYGDEEAMVLLGKLDKIGPAPQIFPTLIENLNALLADKAEQVTGYEFEGRVILVVRVASPVFSKADFDVLEDQIKVPKNLFAEIWLLARDPETADWNGLKRLK